MHVLFVFLCILLFGHGIAQAKRVALVIGNSTYVEQPELKNPAVDATAIAAKLTAANFEVTLGTDLTIEAMRRTINKFAVTVPGSEAALLFFAGHGVQVNGENYLIPVDARIRRPADLTWQTVAVSTLITELEGEGRISIVVLDACRNNPGLSRRLRGLSRATRSLQVGRGLAALSPSEGSYVAYSTAPNTEALDGDGNHSPFARALLKHLLTPGLDIALMMRRVRHDVRKRTERLQTPWTNSSLTQPFYFIPPDRKGAPPSRTAPSQSGDQPSRLGASEAFAATQALGTCAAYDLFMRDYPEGFLAGLARTWQQQNCNTTVKAVPVLPNARASPETKRKKTPLSKRKQPQKRLRDSTRSRKKKASRSRPSIDRKTKHRPVRRGKRGVCSDGNMDHCRTACRKGISRACRRLRTTPAHKRYSGGNCGSGNMDVCHRACRKGMAWACARLRR